MVYGTYSCTYNYTDYTPDANHGAGILAPTFGPPKIWPSYVGKYSSTMVRIWDRVSHEIWGFQLATCPTSRL